MFRDALAAVDGSPSSFQAAVFGAMLADAAGGALELVAVEEGGDRERREADLRSAAALVADYGNVRDACVRRGPVVDAILGGCGAGPERLICVGAGRHARTLGSVSSAIVRRADCPVLVVREGPSAGPRIRRILVGFDGTDAAGRAVDAAARLSADTGGGCLLAWVLEPAWPMPHRGLNLGGGEVQELAGRPEERELAEASARIEAAGGRVELALFDLGDAAERLLARADGWDVDLVVVGATSRSPRRRRLHAGVSDRVVARSRRPVLVVR